jgi:hypothetical protein
MEIKVYFTTDPDGMNMARMHRTEPVLQGEDECVSCKRHHDKAKKAWVSKQSYGVGAGDWFYGHGADDLGVTPDAYVVGKIVIPDPVEE